MLGKEIFNKHDWYIFLTCLASSGLWSLESSLIQCCGDIQNRRAGEPIPLSKHWHNGCVIQLSMTLGWLTLKQYVYVFLCVCICMAFVGVHVHMCVSACACMCSRHRAAVKWVNALKGLLGSPARSVPAIMRMFSVFSSISSPGSLRWESLADARHVADVCYWSDIWK